MCFYNDDYDWTASVVEQSTGVSIGKLCDECHLPIPPGATIHHIFMQEHEECHACENGECECPLTADGELSCDSKGCQCEKPAFGETFDYDRCDECDKFLRAVEAAEIDEGCEPYEARPGLGGMIEELRNLEGDNEVYPAKRYFKLAVKMFPELVTSGYLGRLAKRVF